MFSYSHSGQPTASVTCNSNHTVDILISKVDDAGLWTAPEWTTKTNKKTCQPTIDDNARTVTYDKLRLPDCAFESNQKAEGIQYILKISAAKTAGDSNTPRLRAYDHLYYVTCNYDNTGKVSGSFVPMKNLAVNETGRQLWLR